MDKREAVRVPVRVRAQCRVSDIVVDGLVEDVSRSGMFMRFDSAGPIARGSSAEIELDVSGEPPIHLTAEVVRVEDSGFGLRIIENGSRPLANLIMRQHAVTR